MCLFEVWCRPRKITSTLNLYYSYTFVCVKLLVLHWRGQKCEGSDYFCVFLIISCSLAFRFKGSVSEYDSLICFCKTHARNPHTHTHSQAFYARMQSCDKLLLAPYVCPPFCIRQLGSHQTDFRAIFYWGLQVQEIRVWLKSDASNRHFTSRSK